MPPPKDPTRIENWYKCRMGDNNPSKRPEVRAKISQSRMGQLLSHEQRIKQSKTMKMLYQNGIIIHPFLGLKGKNNPNYGSKRSKDVCDKISKSLKGRTIAWGKKISKTLLDGYSTGRIPKHMKNKKRPEISGENHYNWNGGTSNEPYLFGFNRELKNGVISRFDNLCLLCLKKGILVVHHIDYDKKNNSINNLVPLHAGCHSKTNTHRYFWINYFKEIMRCWN